MSKKIKIKYEKNDGLINVKRKRYLMFKSSSGGAMAILSKRAFFKLKIALIIFATLTIALGMFFLQACNKRPEYYGVDKGFCTVMKQAPSDGSKPSDYTVLDNVAFLNYVFNNQPYYYTEMQGTTSAMGVKQLVSTYKQKNDGVVIVTEITSSSMVKSARQFCYVNDEVIWRNSVDNNFDGLNTEWKEGSPVGHMNVETYKDNYGLPASEFLAYVINESTLVSSSEITNNGDIYSMTVSLDITDKTGAAAYYAKQMVFNGNLNDYPSFDYINLTFTFDDEWNMLSLDVSEGYNATMGISVYCTSNYRTVYSYDQEKASSLAYVDYFKQYEKGEYINPSVVEPTSASCLGTAFSSVLTQPTTFNVKLTIDKTEIDGVVYLDIADAMQTDDILNAIIVRADFGKIKLWIEKGEAYLSIDNIKAKLNIEQAISLIGELITTEKEINLDSLDFDVLLNDLGSGEFNFKDKESASLNSVISLLNYDIPLQFSFLLDQNNAPTLDFVRTDIEFNDLSISAKLTFGERVIEGLSDTQKAEFIELVSLANTIKEILSSEVLKLSLDCSLGEFKVGGEVKLSLSELDENDLLGSLHLSGNLGINYKEKAKFAEFVVNDGIACVSVDGVKIKANLCEFKETLNGLFPTDLNFNVDGLDTRKIISAVFSENFLKAINLTETNNIVVLVVKLNQVLTELGIDLGEFNVGNIQLGVNKINKSISINTNALNVAGLGVEDLSLILSQATELDTVDENNYVDITNVAKTLNDLLREDVIEGQISYEAGKLSVNGNILISLKELNASADLTLNYGNASHSVKVIYKDDYLYLNISGLKIKANVNQTIELITEAMGVDLTAFSGQEIDILEKVFSLDFDSILQLSQLQDAVSVIIDTNALLKIFNVDMSFGDTELNISSNKIVAKSLGIELSLSNTQNNLSELNDVESYIDVIPTAKLILQLVREKGVALSGTLCLDINEIKAKLDIEECAISWVNGLNAIIKGYVEIDNIVLSLYADINEQKVKFIIGGIAVEVEYAKLTSLEDALVNVYSQIYDMIGEMSDTNNPLPEIKGVKDIISFIKGGSAIVQTIEELIENAKQDDMIESILENISLENNVQENGVFTAKLADLTLKLYKIDEGLDLSIECGLEGGKISADISAEPIAEKTIEQPIVEYLTLNDFVEMLDYVSALVNTFTSQDIGLTASLITTTNDLVNYPNGEKQKIDLALDFHSGDIVPLRFNIDGKSIYLNTNLLLHLYLGVDDLSAKNNDLYFDIWLCDEDGNGVLDAIVQVSKLTPSDANYKPVVVRTNTDELMTIISSAASLVGLNEGFISDWIVNKWLFIETASQLEAIGSSLLKTLNFSDILGSINLDLAPTNQKTVYDNLIALGLSKNENGDYDGKFNITLNSKLLFDIDGEDMKLNVQKFKDEDGKSLLSLTQLDNVWLNNGNEKLALKIDTIKYSDIDTTANISSNAVVYNVQGVGELLKVIGKSVTHKTTEQDLADGRATEGQEYVLNRNFFIDGKAIVSLLGYDIDFIINSISVWVDNDGEVVISVKINYGNISIVNNGACELDITIKDGLLYMKKRQAAKKITIFGKEIETEAEKISYRVVPLAGFTANTNDMMNHIGYMFNLSDFIMNLIKNNIKDEQPAEQNTGDFGTLAQGIISSYSYSTNSWKAVLDGSNLTGGILSDVNINIGADSDGLIRDLDVSTKLVNLINISLDLRYRNPMEITESGVTDTSVDMAEILEVSMAEKLAEMRAKDWKDDNGNYIYLTA